MKKNVWIFLFAVLLPSVVLGWLALRSAEEQQIVFERRTAELYQKETDSLAVTVRDTVDAERRAFGETVHRLLAKGDAEALEELAAACDEIARRGRHRHVPLYAEDGRECGELILAADD
jgi:hypothetical protein